MSNAEETLPRPRLTRRSARRVVDSNDTEDFGSTDWIEELDFIQQPAGAGRGNKRKADGDVNGSSRSHPRLTFNPPVVSKSHQIGHDAL